MRVHYATKKPLTVEVTDPVTPENMEEIKDWVKADTWYPYFPDSDYAFTIETLEGEMYVSWGDRIVRGTMGEYWPIKPEAFAASYDMPVPHG